jgi:hypothetical protein
MNFVGASVINGLKTLNMHENTSAEQSPIINFGTRWVDIGINLCDSGMWILMFLLSWRADINVLALVEGGQY